MKKLLILLTIIISLTSCRKVGADECIAKLQNFGDVVYSIDAFNYVVIEDSITYHYIADSRWCSDDSYVRIKIK
jgi:hypothetical protein